MGMLDVPEHDDNCDMHVADSSGRSEMKEPDTLPLDRVLLFITATQREISKVKTDNREDTETISFLMEKALIAARNIAATNKDLCKMKW